MPKKPVKFYFSNYFSEWNWFELLLLAVSFIIPLTVGIIWGSNAIEIILSILLPIAAVLAAKGLFISRIAALIVGVLYIIVSLGANLYGEVIITAAIFMPIKIYGLVAWCRNRTKTKDGKASATVSVSNTTSKELIILFVLHLCLAVGLYFMLRSFNTAFLWVSVASAVINSAATWLLSRRSILAFPMYIVLDFVQFALWLLVFLGGDQGAIALVTSMVLFIVIDTYGMIAWFRMRRKQSEKYD